MEDYDIASEVYSQPDVYGLTYAAYRVLSFDFKAAGKWEFVNLTNKDFSCQSSN